MAPSFSILPEKPNFATEPSSPRIGRPTDGGKRELIISTGASGYIALYQYVPELDTVFVLAIRSPRDAGYAGM